MNCEDWTGEEINVNDENRDPRGKCVNIRRRRKQHKPNRQQEHIYESKQTNVCP